GGRGSVPLIAPAPPAAVLGQGGQAVGAERLAPGPRRDRGWGEELAAHDLLGLEAEGAVVAHAVDHAVHDDALVRVAEREERLRLEVDAELLACLAPRPLVERLARREPAAHGDVPVTRDHVLVGGAQVDEELAPAVEDEDVGRAVRQAAHAHPAARHGGDRAAAGVEDVDQLRVCERIPSRRRAADASRRAALLLLAIAPGYASPISLRGRLARRAPRPPGSVRGFVHKLSAPGSRLTPGAPRT